jgi:hypothetical protein
MGALSNGADLQFALAMVGVVALAMVLAASAVVSRRVRA